MPEPTFEKGVDHRYGGDVCAGCFHTQSEEHPREDVWTGDQSFSLIPYFIGIKTKSLSSLRTSGQNGMYLSSKAM